MIDKLTSWVALKVPSRPFSFKFKLIAAFVGLFVTFIWALVFFSVTVLQTQFNKVLSDQQFASTQRLAAELDSKLRERIQSLTNVAGNFSTDLRPETLDASLAKLKALHVLFPAGITIIGLDGKAIADYPVLPGRRGSYAGDRDYFRNVVATRKAYINKPIIGRTLKRPVLVIAVPILDAAGNLRAVMTGITDLTAANFLGVISDPGMSGKGEFLVISPRDQVIVAATDPKRVLAATPLRGVNAMCDRFLDGFEGSGVATSPAGIPKLMSGKQVSVSGWIVISTLPTAVAFGPVQRMQEYLYAIAGIMTLAAIFIIQWMTRRMLAPLGDASKAMQDMTEGKTPFASLPVERDDEIGKLIGNFNRLAEERQRYELALVESEQRFRKLVESAPDAIFVQTDARFVYVNPAAVRLFGADAKDQLLGQAVVSRMHSDRRHAVEERIRIINEAKRNYSTLEKKYLRMDGSPVEVESSSVPFHYENADSVLIFARDITERKRANEVILESEARYRSLYDNMLDGCAYCRMIYEDGQPHDFIYLDVNPAFERLTGLKNVVGRKISEIMPDIRQTNSELFDIYGRVALGGGAERFENYSASLGQWFDISVYSARRGYFIAVFDVITDKVNAENLLRKQAEEVRALVENSPDMITRFDRDYRCIYVNSLLEKAIGLHRDDILGRTYEEMGCEGEIVVKLMASIAKVIRTELADTFDFSLPTPGGDRYYQARLVPEFGPDGKVLNVVAVARDISVIKGGEAVLRESEQRIHGITANTPGMVFQCLLRARSDALLFTYVSEGSMLLFGLTPAEIQANRHAISGLIAEQDSRAFHDSLRTSANAMEGWNWEGRMILSCGEEKWINCRATPRFSSDSDVIWEGVMLNITDSKRSEQELRQSRQLLRDLSAHMESVLEEERKRIAREVHDELGQALTVLRMDLSLLRLHFGGQSPQLMERIHSMKDGVDRTIQIMRHVTSTLRPVALDLGLVAGLEWLVEEFIKRAGINCQLKTSGCEEVVLDDGRATALFRIVQESLTNVVKHAEASEVEVLIALEGDESLFLEIRDDGKGYIPESTRKSGSFGLIGMHERALMLRGTVDIHSVPGQGTRIEVRIPLILR